VDRQAERKLGGIFQKLSPTDLVGAELQDSRLIYSVVGFMPASDFTDNALLISNLAYLLSQKGLNTCVVDLKVFYPNLYQYFDVKPNKRGGGLIRVLKSDKADFRDELIQTRHERLYLLSPSPYDLIEEYFDFEFEHLERVIETLKGMFDIILLDIPNIPALELSVGAMKYCHVGFFTGSERVDVAGNIMKMLDYVSSIGISTAKFTSVILMNLQNLPFDHKVLGDFGLKIAAALPLVKGAAGGVLEGKLYVKDTTLMNKYFLREMRKLADLLGSQ